MKKLFSVVIFLTLIGFIFYHFRPSYFIHFPQNYSMPIEIPLLETKRSIPNFDHIVIVLLENKTDSKIIGNKNAPFLNSLIAQNALAENYNAISHPSLPNYLAIISGSTFDITSDCTRCFISEKNLIDSLDKAHKSWKAYMESMPLTCFIGSTPLYAQKHDPFIYFDNIRTDPKRCSNITPFENLKNDLANPASVANFIWITPNLCNDMHDCPVAQGDKWLSLQIPLILNSSAFIAQKSLLVITFDEGEGSDNKVVTILTGAGVKKGYISSASYTHYSLLHTIETAWNLPVLTSNDQNAPVMSDFFMGL